MGRMWLILPFVAVLLSGCFFTKVVSVPMRVVGAVASVVPIVGEEVDDAVDAAADTVDRLPF